MAEPGLPLDDPAEAQREALTASARGARAAETRKRDAERTALLAQAMDLYNRAAVHWGFSQCEVLTDARAKRLEARIAEIGGLDRFRVALRAVGRDDFLMGRVQPRSGEQPFRLNIDRLLQTDGRMGDVLARLLESARVAELPPTTNGKDWGWWRGQEAIIGRLGSDWWRQLFDKVKPNGTWPWWVAGAPPGHEECIVPAEVLAERGYVEIYRGQITSGVGHE